MWTQNNERRGVLTTHWGLGAMVMSVGGQVGGSSGLALSTLICLSRRLLPQSNARYTSSPKRQYNILLRSILTDADMICLIGKVP